MCKVLKVEIVLYAQGTERRQVWLEQSERETSGMIKVRKSGRDQITQDLVGPGSLQAQGRYISGKVYITILKDSMVLCLIACSTRLPRFKFSLCQLLV